MIAGQLTRARSGVRIRTIALPAEHGGWGLLLEPISLGLILAPSVASAYLSLAAVGLFLARHPLTLVVLNRRRNSPRTAVARRFAALYVVIGVSAFIAAANFTKHSFLPPFLIAMPFAAVQLLHDWTGRRRVLLSEVAGTIAISSLAPGIVLAGGWPAPASFALWGIMIARSAPAILYVRACLARLHGRPATSMPVSTSHLLALAAVAILTLTGLAPRLAVVAMIILLVRAMIGYERSRSVTPKQLGFSEITFGAITVLAVACGVIFAW